QAIVDLLRTSYNMEIETVANYLANSIHLDGFKAKHIKDALAADITEELTHATQLAQRIKVLEGRVPGSQELAMNQASLQPPENQLDVLSVIHGVIDAEEGAIAQYQKIIEACDGIDPVTQDLCIALKGDEEEHRRLFKGFLAEMLADQ
ncbi:MAG: ferritin-like domain-containing protein, partial [Planctomycetota bacterium]